MTPGIEVELIHEMTGLPYSGSYTAWNAHVPGCTECRMAMASAALRGDLPSPDTLCPVGRMLDVDLRSAIEGQHDSARLN